MKKTAITNKKGMTLLEVLVAVFVLAIVALPLLNMFMNNALLVRRSGEISETTYTAQAVMEDLQGLGYDALYGYAPLPGNTGSYQLRSVTDSSLRATKTVRIDRLPYGGFNNLVGGTASYAHLIINGATATFTGPDGIMRSGLVYASGVSMTSSTITMGGHTYNLNKPSGTNLILIINAGSSAIPSLSISIPSSVPYVLYALGPDDAIKQNFTITNGNANSREYRKFNSKTDSAQDPLPNYMLVNVSCKVYRADGTVESMQQDTLQVSLP